MAQIFCAAVTLVTAQRPRLLTEVCKMMEPMAVMENCSALGRPMESSPSAAFQLRLAFAVLETHDVKLFIQIDQAEDAGDAL